MAKLRTAAPAGTYPGDTLLHIPDGWSEVDPTETARINRSAEAFTRFLTTSAADMVTLIKSRYGCVDSEYREPMTEFWLYDHGGEEVIAVALDRTLDRLKNDKQNPRRKNDWHVTVGVHRRAEQLMTADEIYTAVKQLVAYQLQTDEQYHPMPAITTRQVFTAWSLTAKIKLTQMPDKIFDTMTKDADVTLDPPDPKAAPATPAYGHFKMSTKRVQIKEIILR